ncbi:hypothetical protein QCA50_014891 [Cerrena zonata]|uniref:G-protein coupled receptors family 1 profile domain-containing protein n=1 Tax=Cerrena zonata TaxID=2478898 RepID=A0AAW0FQT5_9APHY
MSADPSDVEFLLQALREVRTMRYLGFATCTIFAYDLMLGIAEDVHLFFGRSLRIPDIVYILSRTLIAAVSFLGLASAAVPLDSCAQATMIVVVKWCMAIAAPCNCWLFFLRVRAIYVRSPIVVGIFLVLWASTLTSFASPFGYKVTSTDEGNGRCTMEFHYDRLLGAVFFIALVVFDTAVIVAVSLWMLHYSLTPTWRARIRTLISGDDTGHTGRIFLQSGQIYYITTVCVHVSLAAMILSSSVSTGILGTLVLFSTVFQNLMACHVFRLLKLEPAAEDSMFSIPVVFWHDISSSKQSSGSDVMSK